MIKTNELKKRFTANAEEFDQLMVTTLSYITYLEKTNSMSGVIIEVEKERARQDEKWGGPAYDDNHSTTEFVQLIEDYAGWARTMINMDSPEKARKRLIQVAALAVAAAESIDRKTGDL